MGTSTPGKINRPVCCLIAVSLCLSLTGCTKRYNARYDTQEELKQNFKIDKTECAKLSNASMTDIYSYCMYKRGWTTDKNEYERQKKEMTLKKQAAQKDISKFMSTHPEYQDETKHTRLTIEASRLMNDPMNKGLSLYQLLILADERLKAQATP
ncbi:hypothetical protein [Citrobacter sp. NCU1]|uniref:hypothetical protein n=1 Tax=Citrobacter sp. NCU1 TaxID=2026683 RepID=UPI00139175A0|nr:hypothetical protein [Citrobacter sp. NCU1]